MIIYRFHELKCKITNEISEQADAGSSMRAPIFKLDLQIRVWQAALMEGLCSRGKVVNLSPEVFNVGKYFGHMGAVIK